MLLWSLVLAGICFTNVALMLATFWYVYGIWPISWVAFFVLAFAAYGQQELAKHAARKLMESYRGTQ